MADKQQADKFKAAARELETDNDPAAFDRRMKKLKLAKPTPKKKPSSKEKSR